MKKYLSEYPELLSEWHPTKNKDLKPPEKYTHGSNVKVWWKCPKGDDHEWQASIYSRTKKDGSGCSVCGGQKASKTNNLLVLNPKLASEWHPTKNGDKRPEDSRPHSNLRVWWKCPKGDDHEWQATITHRNRKIGGRCPFCSGKRASKTNNLLVLNPKVASEWHPTKNGDKRPEHYTLGSRELVWWKCPKGDDNVWDAYIFNRTRKDGGTGCPVCAGQQVSKTNNLLVLNPKLASEWHPTKNGDKRPEEFLQYSNEKVWWKCPKGDDHEWDAIIQNRSLRGDSCIFCSSSGTSKPEIRILCELRYLFGSDEVEWRNKIHGKEIDIFLCQHNIGIEYDGFHWHEGFLQSDIKKNKFFQKKGIQIIRVREHPLQVISKNDVIHKKTLNKNDLNTLVYRIKEVLKPSFEIDFNDYINKSNFLNEKVYKRFISFLPSHPPEYSILNTHPEIAKQWHYEKNGDLRPEHYTHGSDEVVWWKCPKGDDHEWESSISNRIKPSGCPYCGKYKASKTDNLLVHNPKLASEWHPTKNGDLRPEDFRPFSSKKVWWKCPKGDDHEWQATIGNRNQGRGCRICYEIRKTKLTKRKLNEIKRLRETGLTFEKISKEVEISIATVHKVIKNMRRKSK